MALRMRRPVSESVGLLTGHAGLRCFSTSFPKYVSQRQMTPQQPRRSAEQSVKIAAQQQQKLPGDIGLLQDTFVAPSAKNRPSFFSQPRNSLKVQWTRIKRKLQDKAVLLIYYFQIRKPRKDFWKLLTNRQVAPTAVGLHRQMYEAFASGDRGKLHTICVEGLRDSFATRIAMRKTDKVSWELVKYNGTAKVMSNRVANSPIEGGAIRQAVVRISSRQKLTRTSKDGKVYDGSGKEKDITEYVVIQKMVVGGKEEDWMVWGTTEETTLKKIQEAEAARLAA